MERRNLLQMMAAAGVAPIVPFSKAAVAAPMAAHTPVQYAWAAHYARVHNTASPARLMTALKVAPEVANGLMAKLIEAGVIHAPTAGGMSAAMKPFPKTQHLRTGLQDPMRTAIGRLNKAARSAVKNNLAHDPEGNLQSPRQTKRITPPPLTGHLNSLG